jgi:hypothetical protein
MLFLGWIVLLAGAAAVAVAPVPRPFPQIAALGAGAIGALLITVLLPEPRPVVKKRQTRVTFWDQHVDLIAAANARPVTARPKPQPDDAYRSHPIAA